MRDIGMIEHRPLFGNTVNGRSSHQLAAIGTDGLEGMIIGNNDHHIGLLLGLT